MSDLVRTHFLARFVLFHFQVLFTSQRALISQYWTASAERPRLILSKVLCRLQLLRTLHGKSARQKQVKKQKPIWFDE